VSVRPLRNRYLLLADTVLLTAVVPLAYILRFTGLDWGQDQRWTALCFVALAVPIKLIIFYAAGLYQRLWRHASTPELEAIALGAGSAGAASMLLGAVLLPWTGLVAQRVPLSVLALDVLLGLVVAAAPRLALRIAHVRSGRRRLRGSPRVLIAGAGAAGQMIAKELLSNVQLGLIPVGFVDDNPAKHKHRLLNLPVFGALDEIPEIVERKQIAEVIIAMPSATGAVIRQVVQDARVAGVRTRTVPGLFEIIAGNVGVSTLRDVRIEDLLRREPIRTDLDSVRAIVHGQTVMVTGAGGSIGSELCRQLAELAPGRLILLGHGENSIFEIQNELTRTYSWLRLTPVIADVRDLERMRAVCKQYHPHAIFHAAAHKHVPLMEENIAEAITNNVLGTRNMVTAAAECRVPHFVLISTDKAVRPTSVMGATKRAAELTVQQAALQHGRNYVAVRFGNVLGSRGSVVPTFLKQIRAGGPITITHPEMRRYFMTIPEAVQLVLQAGALGAGGEVFVLDMGEPVKIIDLAADLIRLSGLEVGTDIEITSTGMRPGEKLYEELFFDDEHAAPTEHPKVLRAKYTELVNGEAEQLEELIRAAQAGASDEQLRRMLHALIPDFTGRDGSWSGQWVAVQEASGVGRQSPENGLEIPSAGRAAPIVRRQASVVRDPEKH
jgi:FlaA1/EpsC-like NDP-sugar epimerase